MVDIRGTIIILILQSGLALWWRTVSIPPWKRFWPPNLWWTLRASRSFIGHHPPCVYHLSTWCHHTWPNLPGLPPPYLHTASDQILKDGMGISLYIRASKHSEVLVFLLFLFSSLLLCSVSRKRFLLFHRVSAFSKWSVVHPLVAMSL